MSKSICLFLGVLLCIAGCKKSEESEPKPTFTVSGEFQLTKTTPWWGNTVTFAYAQLFDDSVVHVDSVMVDNSPLTYESRYLGYYMETGDTALIGQPVTWRVKGTNSVPSFVHTLSGGFPDFDLPHFSSIGKDTALNVVLPAGTLANADTAWVVLTKDSVSLRHGIDRITATAVFSPTELNLFQPMGSVDMRIVAAKYDTLKIQGATFRFSRSRDWKENNIRID